MVLIPDEIERYASSHSTPEAPWLRAAAEATATQTELPGMLTGHLEGGFLEFVAWALRPRLVVEVGTFTGYGSMSLAAGLPDGGRIVTCEIDAHHAALARGHIADSPFAHRIEVREGPALETIATITGPVDLAFIDADKEGYLDYYEALVPKLSERGVIAADNVLWSGRIIDPAVSDPDTEALRAFNDRVVEDQRVTCVMTTVRDGVTLIRRR
ncbi:MAG TPA: O-methyltransferase [Acidimicrobiales bacterium]|nr:O-methyltransferase [Acidimicrobiales bacterium]